jgi:hypothetical protein
MAVVQVITEICHLAMTGTGPRAAARVLEAVSDHNDIREAIREAQLEPAGSAAWWRAVSAALVVSTQHMDAEERGVLPDCGRHWSASRRQDLDIPRP